MINKKIIVGSIISLLLLVVIFVIIPALTGFPYSFGNKGSDNSKPDPKSDKCKDITCDPNAKCEPSTGKCMCISCNDHGECNESTGKCSCDTNYYGEYCQNYVDPCSHGCEENEECNKDTGECKVIRRSFVIEYPYPKEQQQFIGDEYNRYDSYEQAIDICLKDPECQGINSTNEDSILVKNITGIKNSYDTYATLVSCSNKKCTKSENECSEGNCKKTLVLGEKRFIGTQYNGGDSYEQTVDNCLKDPECQGINSTVYGAMLVKNITGIQDAPGVYATIVPCTIEC